MADDITERLTNSELIEDCPGPGDFIAGRDGKPKPLLANAVDALRSSPAWAGVLAFDEFSMKIVADQPPPWSKGEWPGSREWTELDDKLAADWLQRFDVFVGPDVAAQAVEIVSQDRAVHPVRAYLDGLEWDGERRIVNWLSYYLGVDASDYASEVGLRWLLSGVARIFDPGCKADCALILEGEQGLGKSTALRVLGKPWFSDEIGEFGSKDASLQIAGAWIIEISELGGMNRSDVSHIKAFMSRSVDRFRPPYGRRLIEVPRQCVFAGTVNGSGYLRDETGSRRFWPVLCRAIDVPALEADRNQIWAEAVHRYRQGEVWWIDDPSLRDLAETEQAERYIGDPWNEIVDEYCANSPSVSIRDILQYRLGIPEAQLTQRDMNRVAKILTAKGWVRDRRGPRVDGRKPPWRYYPPDGPTILGPDR